MKKRIEALITYFWPYIAKILLKFVPLRLPLPQAQKVTPEQAPHLWQAVHSAAASLGNEAPDHIFIGSDFDFFATEMPVFFSGKTFKGKSLYLSLSALKCLSSDDVLAMITHELGYLADEREKHPLEYDAFYGRSKRTVRRFMESSLLGRLGFLLLNFSGQIKDGERPGLDRDRTFSLDQKAAEIVGVGKYAAALLRGHAEIVLSDSSDYHAKGNPFLEVDAMVRQPAFWKELLSVNLFQPAKNPPTLKERLEKLKRTFTVEEGRVLMSALPETSAFQSWLPDAHL